METTIESRFLLLQQTRIHYLEVGLPQWPTVLFLHGASFSSQTWQDLGTLAFLAEHSYRAVAIDLPGFGQHPPLHFHVLSAELQDTLDFLTPTQCWCLTLSHGGRP